MGVGSIFVSTCETLVLSCVGYAVMSVVFPMVGIGPGGVVEWALMVQVVGAGLSTLLHCAAAFSQKISHSLTSTLHHGIALTYVGVVTTILVTLGTVVGAVYVPGSLLTEEFTRAGTSTPRVVVYVSSALTDWAQVLRGGDPKFEEFESSGLTIFKPVDAGLVPPIVGGAVLGYLLVVLGLALHTGYVSAADDEFTPLIFDSKVVGLVNVVVCNAVPQGIHSVYGRCGDPLDVAIWPMVYILYIVMEDWIWVSGIKYALVLATWGTASAGGDHTETVGRTWRVMCVPLCTASQLVPFLYLTSLEYPEGLWIFSGILSIVGSLSAIYGAYSAYPPVDEIVPAAGKKDETVGLKKIGGSRTGGASTPDASSTALDDAASRGVKSNPLGLYQRSTGGAQPGLASKSASFLKVAPPEQKQSTPPINLSLSHSKPAPKPGDPKKVI
jgi:hypothetical protein